MSVLSAIFGFLFVAAQGGAVFITAYALAQLFRTKHWAAKTVLMIVSLLLWATFTLFLLFWGADSYVIFMGLVVMAALSSAVYWLAWILAPLFQDKVVVVPAAKQEKP